MEHALTRRSLPFFDPEGRGKMHLGPSYQLPNQVPSVVRSPATMEFVVGIIPPLDSLLPLLMSNSVSFLIFVRRCEFGGDDRIVGRRTYLRGVMAMPHRDLDPACFFLATLLVVAVLAERLAPPRFLYTRIFLDDLRRGREELVAELLEVLHRGPAPAAG